jgi:hypothetical protein
MTRDDLHRIEGCYLTDDEIEAIRSRSDPGPEPFTLRDLGRAALLGLVIAVVILLALPIR